MPASRSDGGLYFKSGVDTTKFRADIRLMESDVEKLNGNVRKESDQTSQLLAKLGAGFAGFLTLQGMYNFGKKIAEVRGQFQQLQIALETMLGSKVVADEMMAKMVDFAAKTPFSLLEVSQGSKQLAAIGTDAEMIIPTLKALGDVSSGLGIELSRLVLNYGQVKTQGKLMGREMKDFQIMGIDLVKQLSISLGKSEADIRKLQEAGKIGFGDVEKAFQDMTSTGGKFENLMFKQSASITGQISNLGDNVDKMLNSIGQANEGVLYGIISVASGAVSNYQTIIDVLEAVAVTYGTYKAALLAVMVAEKLQAFMSATVTTTNMYGVAVTRQMTTAQLAQAAASRVQAAAMAINPYVAVATVLAVIVSSLMIWKSTQEDLTDTIAEGNAKIGDFAERIKKLEGIKTVAKEYDDLNKILNKTPDEIERLAVATNKLVSSGVDLSKVSDSMVNYVGTEVDFVKKLYQKSLDEQKTNLDALVKRQATIFENLKTKKKDVTVQVGGQYSSYTKQEAIKLDEKELATLRDEWIKNNEVISTTTDKINGVQTAINNIGKEKPPVAFNKEYWDGEKTRIQVLIDELDSKDAEFKSKKANYEKEMATVDSTLKRYESSEKSKNEDEKSTKLAEEKLKNQKSLSEAEIQIARNTETAKTEAAAEGIQKQIDQEKFAHKERLDRINQSEQDYISKLNESKGLKVGDKGFIATLGVEDPQKKSFDEQRVASASIQIKAIKEINRSAVVELKGIWDDAHSQYMTNLEQEKKSIDDKYDEMIRRAKELGKSDIIPSLNKARGDEKNKATVNSQVDELDLQQQIEEKKVELDNKGTNRTSVVEKLKYEIVKKYSLMKISLLNAEGSEESVNKAKQIKLEIDSGEIDNAEKKRNLQQQLISGALEFTDILIQQLGLSKEQAESMKHAVSLISNVSSGNYVGAALSALQLVMSTFHKNSVDTTELMKKNIDKTNKALELQGHLLESLSGSDYYTVAVDRLETINTKLDSYNKKLKETEVYDARRGRFKIDTSKWTNNDWVNAVNNDTYSGFSKETVTATLEEIFKLKKEYISVVNQMYNDILGFTSDNVAESIFSGIQDGLALSDTGLGDWSKSFGDIVKKALMKGISDAMNMKLTDGFMKDFNAFMANDGTIDPAERKILQDEYIAAIKEGKIKIDEMNKITDVYGSDIATTNQTQMEGAVKGMNAETIGLIAGQFMAMQINLKAMTDIGINSLEVLHISNGSLARIEVNTSLLSDLAPIKAQLIEMNATLKSKL